LFRIPLTNGIPFAKCPFKGTKAAVWNFGQLPFCCSKVKTSQMSSTKKELKWYYNRVTY